MQQAQRRAALAQLLADEEAKPEHAAAVKQVHEALQSLLQYRRARVTFIGGGMQPL